MDVLRSAPGRGSVLWTVAEEVEAYQHCRSTSRASSGLTLKQMMQFAEGLFLRGGDCD